MTTIIEECSKLLNKQKFNKQKNINFVQLTMLQLTMLPALIVGGKQFR